MNDPRRTRTIKSDIRVDKVSGIKYNHVNIKQALKIATGECGFTMFDARGAIRTFLDQLDFQDKGIFMPKGETLATWLEKLRLTYLQKVTSSEVLKVIKDQ